MRLRWVLECQHLLFYLVVGFTLLDTSYFAVEVFSGCGWTADFGSASVYDCLEFGESTMVGDF